MHQITYPDIPRSVMATLLDIAGKPKGISPRPLMGEPLKLNQKQISELSRWEIIVLSKTGGISLSHRFARVSEVLLDPHTNINFRIWGNNNICAETSILFPGFIMEGNGVILNQIGSYYRIRAFVDDSSIFDLMHPILPMVIEENVVFEFEGHFDVSDTAVLFGAIDLARRQARTRKKPNERDDGLMFSIDQLSNYIFDEWGLSGFNQFITYIAVSGMKPVPPSISEMTRSIESLERAKALIKVDTKHYSISPVLEPLVDLTIGLESGLQWQRVSIDPLGELETANRIYLFGDQSLTLCLSPTTEGRLFISKVKQNELLDFLIQEITTFPTSTWKDSMPSMISSPKPQKSQMSPTTPLMPPRSETEIKPPPQKEVDCTKCGATLSPNNKFCIQCGTPAGNALSSPKTPEAPVNRICSKCGAKVRQGRKFCTECGSPIVKK